MVHSFYHERFMIFILGMLIDSTTLRGQTINLGMLPFYT